MKLRKLALGLAVIGALAGAGSALAQTTATPAPVAGPPIAIPAPVGPPIAIPAPVPTPVSQ